jgi:metallo-beta-lactamase family protein
LLEWLSHFRNPNLQVFINHGEGKISMELSEIICQQFHFNTTVPQWKEKRLLFAPEREVMPEEEATKVEPSEEKLSVLFQKLERNYKRLRRKLKKGKSRKREFQDPRWLRRLEELNKKLEELESELD